MEKVEKLVNKKKQIVEMQVNVNGNMSAREKVNNILDQGSFIELNQFLQGNGGGVITGYGTVNGKLVYIFSQDFSINGGAVSVSNSKKICEVMDMAAKMGAPIIEIYDSIGAKIDEGLSILEGYAGMISRNAKFSGVIPQIAVVAGPCTGIAAISASMADFTIMVNGNGELYISNPETLIQSENTYVDPKMYAGANECCENGSVQFAVESEFEAVEIVKKLIDHMPSNNLEIPSVNANEEFLSGIDEELNSMVNENKASMRRIIETIADKGSLLETCKNYDPETITAFIKLNGMTLGVIANSEGENVRMSMNGIEKITRMIKTCNCFNIPMLTLVNSVGFAKSLEDEKKGLAVNASKMICALAQAVVPKVSLIVGKAYGSAYAALASKNISFDMVYAWPGSKIALAEPEALAVKLHREEVVSSENPKKAECQLVQNHGDELSCIYTAAEMGFIDDIIVPSETKMRLFSAFDMLQSKRELSYPKKHGSVLV